MKTKGFLTIIFTILFVGMFFAQDMNKTDSKGRKQGKWIKYYEGTNNKRYVGQFVDDIPTGKFTYYYDTGEPSAVSVFSENGIVTRTKTYHKNGNLMATGKYINHEKDSVWWYFNDRKEVLSRENYIKGKLDGEVVIYYPTDPSKDKLKIYEITTYKDGVKNGEWKQYFSNGKLKAKGVNKDGYYDGKVYWYFQSGKLEIEAFYKHTVANGFWIYFDEEGNVKQKVYYLNGKVLEGEKLEQHLEKLRLEKEQSKG